MRLGPIIACVSILAVGLRPAPALGEEAAAPPPERSGSALATAAAVFPGLLLPGVGHFVLGETEAGKRYLVLDAIGIALLAAGFGGQAATGGADRLAPLVVVPQVAGMSLLSILWLSDVVGSAHGTAEWEKPREPQGNLSAAIGYTGLFGSRLDFHHGIQLDARIRARSFTARPWGLFDVQGSHYGMGARLEYVVWEHADRVTRLALGAEVTHHRFRVSRYSTTVGAGYAELRLDLGNLTRTLRNTYLLGRLGAGVEGFAYDASPFDASDLSPVLVLELGAGLQVAQRVNLEFLYRNRKDELPGGIVLPGIFDSYLGIFELRGRVTIDERFAVLAGLRWGNGLMPWISFESQVF